MTLFCKYKDILGKPQEGTHSARWFKTDNFEGLARNDIVMTILGALILTFIIMFVYQSKYGKKIGFGKTFGIASLGLFFLGFLMHLLFCVKTPLTKNLLS
jgi:hypothetical protein